MRLLQLKGHGGFRNGKRRRALFLYGLFSVHTMNTAAHFECQRQHPIPSEFGRCVLASPDDYLGLASIPIETR
jgi:hypothetical protein